MHYHYFTLEQRSTLEQAIRSQLADQDIKRAALERLRSPEYGVCESCGADIPFVSLAGDPTLKRCPACRK